MNEAKTPLEVPRPLGSVLRRLPQWPPSAGVCAVLNLGLMRRLDQAALAQLQGKVIRIVARDAGLCITVCFDGRVFRPRFAGERADVTISASAHDFGLLAARKEDPDTLFFARRLTMEGDTELGLMVKNILDAVDLSAVLVKLEKPLALLQRLRGQAAPSTR